MFVVFPHSSFETAITPSACSLRFPLTRSPESVPVARSRPPPDVALVAPPPSAFDRIVVSITCRWSSSSSCYICAVTGERRRQSVHLHVPVAPEWGARIPPRRIAAASVPWSLVHEDQCGSWCGGGSTRPTSMMGYIMGCTCFKGIDLGSVLVQVFSCSCLEGTLLFSFLLIECCNFWVLSYFS